MKRSKYSQPYHVRLSRASSCAGTGCLRKRERASVSDSSLLGALTRPVGEGENFITLLSIRDRPAFPSPFLVAAGVHVVSVQHYTAFGAGSGRNGTNVPSPDKKKENPVMVSPSLSCYCLHTPGRVTYTSTLVCLVTLCRTPNDAGQPATCTILRVSSIPIMCGICIILPPAIYNRNSVRAACGLKL